MYALKVFRKFRRTFYKCVSTYGDCTIIGCEERHTSPSLVSVQIFLEFSYNCGVFCGLETGLPQKSGLSRAWIIRLIFIKSFIQITNAVHIYDLIVQYIYILYTY
jgi:hypothetical protein